jgi:hypothetical protein
MSALCVICNRCGVWLHRCPNCDWWDVLFSRSREVVCGHCNSRYQTTPLLGSSDDTEEETGDTAGHVYVLVNSTMPGIVKIGKTQGDPEARAAELSGTGVAVPFVVAYSELVEDCHEVERLVHAILAPHRVNEKREFFRVSSRRAIEALREAIDQTRRTNS